MSLQPVEIELRLKQNLDTESKKASEGMRDVSRAANDTHKEVRENIAIQKKVIAQLRAELKPLEAEFKKVNHATHDPKVAAERQRLLGIIREMRGELKGEVQALSELEKRTQGAAAKMSSLRTQMQNTRNTMAQLRLAGRENTEEFRRLEAQLGTLGTAYREMQTLEKAASTGGTQLAGFMDGLNALSGTLSAGAGAMALFNGDSEKMAAIQTKLQGIMAISIGLMQVSNVLHSTSAFRITTVRKAKELWAGANLKLATSLGISTVAAKVLMATLTLGLSVAITAVMVLLDRFVSKQRQTANEQRKINAAVADAAAGQMASFNKLKKGYEALNGNIDAQNKYLADNRSEFEKLGLTLNNVNDAEKIFSTQGTEAFKKAIMERAKSIALMEIAAEKYKTIVVKQLQHEGMETGTWAKNRRKDEFKKQIDADIKNWEIMIDTALKHESASADALAQAGQRNAKTLLEGSKAYWEAQKQDAKERIEAMRDIEMGSEAWRAQLSRFREAEEKLKAWNLTPDNKDENKQKEAFDKLRKLNVSLQEEIDAAVIAAMEDGAAKKLAALNADYEKRKNVITERLKEIEALEKVTGKPATTQREKLSVLDNAIAKQYASDRALAEQAAALEVQKVWSEVNSRHRTELQNRLSDTNRFYDDQLKVLKKNIVQEDVLKEAAAKIEHDRNRELQRINTETALQQIDFQTAIDIKRQQIANRSIVFETHRQENLLRIELDGAKKRLKKLRELQDAGGDTAAEIEHTEMAVQALNAQLAEMPVNKMKELGDFASKAMETIAEFASVFDEEFAKGLQMLDQTMRGLTEITAGALLGDPQMIVEGGKKLLTVVGDAIKANRQANREIRDFNYSIAKQAIDYSIAVIKAIKDVKGEFDSIFIDNQTNTLSQGMSAYEASLNKQRELTDKLGEATVKTGVKKKKFLGITTGTKDIYSNLLKEYPKLVDEAGNLNRELAETLLSAGNLSKEARDTIQQIIEAEGIAADAMQQVESILQSMVGTLGNDLKNALDDAFRSGTDSARTMTENVAKMMEQLASQQLFNTVFGALFSQLEYKMKQSFGADGDGDITDELAWFMDNYPALVDAYNQGLEKIQEKIKDETGIDPYADTDGRSGFTKGIAQASQDSIDELNGRVMAISGNVYTINQNSIEMLGLQRESVMYYKAMYSLLDVIAINTAYCRYLENVHNSLDDINTRGVKLRQ
ncbi:hypothetical protein [Alkaliflexus imshenetskii]|uniref:hypothetical protein n=1 Tax=Alkaliflexus imshenetskii TaxID=286730 RepID=UPI00047AEB92|nr:hypothetical protein [Alkaliflexus imshenetskii]